MAPAPTPADRPGITHLAPRAIRIDWGDPAEQARVSAEGDGLAYLEAIRSGALPPCPMWSTIGIGLTMFEPGRARVCVTPSEHHYNPHLSCHGGMIATVLDAAMGCAVQTLLSVDEGYTVVEFKTSFMRPVTADGGPVFGDGSVLHRGRRTALAEARIVDAAGRLHAHATGTILILRHEGMR